MVPHHQGSSSGLEGQCQPTAPGDTPPEAEPKGQASGAAGALSQITAYCPIQAQISFGLGAWKSRSGREAAPGRWGSGGRPGGPDKAEAVAAATGGQSSSVPEPDPRCERCAGGRGTLLLPGPNIQSRAQTPCTQRRPGGHPLPPSAGGEGTLGQLQEPQTGVRQASLKVTGGSGVLIAQAGAFHHRAMSGTWAGGACPAGGHHSSPGCCRRSKRLRRDGPAPEVGQTRGRMEPALRPGSGS